ncbi:FAD-dependent oxidoreductase [Nonomuraea sp. NEAU-A123]|uniref:FAD-dependent oxidoreductase n=1 Tax=Nonomuraea sp. NEAU-A123 TaxID=2839649 RepID=UPI0020327A04|nr:FAD-dependent oxidoreductase [Nonomuraea sp. NEAU-A123]
MMSRTVVVIGGGYGGSALAKALDSEADVVLIDPRDAFINSAGSLRALTQPDWAHNMFFPYGQWLRRGTVVRDRAVSVDPGGVTLASGRRVDADYLVLATGSSYAYPAKPTSDATDKVLDDLRRTHKELAGAERVLILGAGQAATFTATTTGGEEITADIWFRAHGVRVNSDYLADDRLTTRTPQGQVPVTETLNVHGYDHVYAIGDITDVAETKMAGYAMQHAEVVAQNIIAQLRGEQPTATYEPLPHPMILLPLGPRGGVGQLPTPDGPAVVPVETVSAYKGADLFTGRFTEQFGAA